MHSLCVLKPRALGSVSVCCWLALVVAGCGGGSSASKSLVQTGGANGAGRDGVDPTGGTGMGTTGGAGMGDGGTVATGGTGNGKGGATATGGKAGTGGKGGANANGGTATGTGGTATTGGVATGTGGAVIDGGAVGNGGLLPADRATTWKPGVTYNGGIPTNRTVCATLTPLGGTKDDAPQIQAALNACPANGMVQLNAGTFLISTADGVTITKSDITLRGAGPGVTTLLTKSDQPILFVGTKYYSWIQQTAFTADAVKDTDSVTLAKDPGLKVGEVVHVNETYDPALTWYNQDTGQDGDYQGWGEGRKGAMAQSRPIGQAMVVASISGTTVKFTTPFHMNFRVARAAHLARIGNGNTPVGVPVHNVGVEELTLSGGGGGDQAGNLRFTGVSRCWAKHIESTQSQSSGFAIEGSVQCELRDSYIHTTQDPEPGGGGYGIVIDTYAADNLIENSISWNFNKVMVMRSSGGGNVIGYNYMTDSWGKSYPTLPETGINASHMATPQHELFEGNESHNFGSDVTWGNSIYITAFRNHLTGLRRSFGTLKLSDQGNRRCAEIGQADNWFSFIGNVLGYSGMALSAAMPGGNTGQTAFAYEPAQDSDKDARMWQLMEADAATQATLLRMGNFDWATKTQKWPGIGGIGTKDSPPNPLPTIPDSFYAPGKPAFMGANPWPWVNPTTGETFVLPARARFDAGTPNTL